MSDTNSVKLTIKISNTKPISLIDLTVGLTALGSLYNNFTKDDDQAKLLVKDIRKGSIVIDLITLSAVSAVPLLSNVHNIVQFFHFIELLVATCSKSSATELQEMTSTYSLPTPTTKDIKSWGKSLNIIADNNDNVDYTVQEIDNSAVYNNCIFNGAEASFMKKNICELMDDNTKYEYKKKHFKWVQTNFHDMKIGNKGLIKNLHDKALRVIFDDENTKRQMIEDSDGNISWQDKYYTVDVELQMGEKNKPIQYKILKNYKEESFFPDEN